MVISEFNGSRVEVVAACHEVRRAFSLKPSVS